MKDFLQLAIERYSARKFSDQAIEQEKIDKIIEAGRRAPTAVNFQPYKIWIAKSECAKNKLIKTTRFPFVGQAPVIFAVGAAPNEAWVRKYDGKNFADIDAAIVATQMMLEIHDLGLGTTWIGSFDEHLLKSEFPQMRNYNMIALFPVGYIADDCEPSELHFSLKDRAVTVEAL